MYSDITTLCIESGRTIIEAIRLMDQSRMGIVLVVDRNKKLIGTITDGDIRRSVLAKISFSESVDLLLKRKGDDGCISPVTASIGAEESIWIDLLKQHKISHLPLLDSAKCVKGLVKLDELLLGRTPGLEAIVMAGGEGQRLMPLTENTPKPMLPVGDKPLLEIILKNLADAGITKVKVATHHKPETIKTHFGDGKEFGVDLSYVSEERPLGTAGGLGLLKPPDQTTLVINGDILTNVDFRAMLSYHKEHQADLTVAVRHYDLKVPYGVVECAGPAVERITEKPVFGVFVNAGIYLLEPTTYCFIPNDEHFHMTQLIGRFLSAKRVVVSFPIHEEWLDIGNHTDYQRAQELVKDLKVNT